MKTERQKQVKVSALIKMETFLNDVYVKIGNGDSFSLDELARSYKMSGSVATLIKRHGIVTKISQNVWQWSFPTKGDRALALTLIDELNRVSGKWNGKNLLEKALSQDATPNSLFGKPENTSDKTYLAGCIASSVYTVEILETDRDIDGVNERIIFAVNNLLNHLNNSKS